MKKVNVYFAEPQLTALAAAADQLGIPAAEILRRALDTWLAHHTTGGRMAETTTPADVTTAYVKVVDEGYTRSWRNADIVEDSYTHTIEVWRGEDRKLASFSAGSVECWYIEEPEAQ